MFGYAFRFHRNGMIGFGAAAGLITLATGAAYPRVAGATPASRAAFGQVAGALAPQMSYLMTAPHRLDTLAGYLLWKGWGVLPLVIGLWAVLAAVGAARGDEERHLVDAWLAAGVSRSRLVVARLAGFGAAMVVVAAAIALGTALGAARVSGPGAGLSAGGLVGQAAALWLLGWSCFSLCYLMAQLPASGTAATGLVAAVLAALYLLDAAARSQPGLGGVAWLSPFRWYEGTDALAPGGHLAVAGLVLAAALVPAAGALAAWAFGRRDVGRGVWARPERTWAGHPRAASPLLGWPVARLLYRDRVPLLLWALASAALAVALVGVAGGIAALQGLPTQATDVFTHGIDDLRLGFIAVFWSSVAQLVLAGFAGALVASWTTDDTQGVLAAVLGQPVARGAVVIERLVAAVVALLVVAAAGSLAAALTAGASGPALPPGRIMVATVLLVPFGLVFAAAGAAVGGWWPRAAALALGSLAVLSFVDADLATLLGFPAWAGRLSVFNLYGTPLLTGTDRSGLLWMVVVVAVGFGVAVLGLRRRDVV